MGFVDTGYSIPQCLHSCLSIRKLSLVGCQLEIHGNVQWDQLKFLTIDGVPLNEREINQILAGAPQLEVLILRLADSFENLNICSSSLKMLTIEKFDDGEDTVLTIWAPNVETLDISGYLYGKCVLMNVSSLTHATVGFLNFPDDYDNGGFFGYKLLEDIVGQVCHSSRHVEKVGLSYWCIKMLGRRKKKDVLAPLSNAKHLKLYDTKVDQILGLLEFFPKLTKLFIEDGDLKITDECKYEVLCGTRESFVTKFDTENSLESITDFPNSCLLYLTTVEIAWNGRNKSIFPSTRFLLKYASKLEKLLFRVKGSKSLQPESLLLTAEKLLGMPRSSPTAEVILFKE